MPLWTKSRSMAVFRTALFYAMSFRVKDIVVHYKPAFSVTSVTRVVECFEVAPATFPAGWQADERLSFVRPEDRTDRGELVSDSRQILPRYTSMMPISAMILASSALEREGPRCLP
jgi:hypothetical protein